MNTENTTQNNYTFLKNMKYYYKNLLQRNPGLFIGFFLAILPEILLPLGTIGMTRTFTAGIAETWEPAIYLSSLAGIGGFLLLCTLLQRGLNVYCGAQTSLHVRSYEMLIARKKMYVDYEILESKRFKDQAAEAEEHLWNHNALNEQMFLINEFLTSFIGSMVFGLTLAVKNPWILLLLFLSAAVSFLMSRSAQKYEQRQENNLTATRREMEYVDITSKSISDGKDIRLYNMGNWFLHIYRSAFERQNEIYRKIWYWYYSGHIVETSLKFLLDILVYIYLIREICQGSMSIADLVFYTGIVTTLSGWLNSTVSNMYALGNFSFTLTCIRKFLDIPDRTENHGSKKTDIPKKQAVEIVFDHVSYRYPGAKKDTIHDLTLTIKAGEKLALVGLNGAGKTTLVKLLCRLYHPTAGKILLNGTCIEEFERTQYFSLLSVLFQDISLLPVSIDENTAVCTKEEIDYEHLDYAYKASGIYDKIHSLPQKGDTHMQRAVWDDAVDLSGGERQKLLLARAVYSPSSILILDEPTAALDPIAEHNIYMQYKDLSAGRTTLFISHRLASTRFCDRIVLLENGQIAEEGTHESLLAQKGSYTRLFELQSEYYKEKTHPEVEEI